MSVSRCHDTLLASFVIDLCNLNWWPPFPIERSSLWGLTQIPSHILLNTWNQQICFCFGKSFWHHKQKLKWLVSRAFVDLGEKKELWHINNGQSPKTTEFHWKINKRHRNVWKLFSSNLKSEHSQWCSSSVQKWTVLWAMECDLIDGCSRHLWGMFPFLTVLQEKRNKERIRKNSWISFLSYSLHIFIPITMSYRVSNPIFDLEMTISCFIVSFFHIYLWIV